MFSNSIPFNENMAVKDLHTSIQFGYNDGKKGKVTRIILQEP